MAVEKRSHRGGDGTLLAIALFKFVKGMVLLALVYGAINMWHTIIATSSFMPLELYELIKKFSVLGLLLLLVNAAVVLFLVYRVRD